MSFENAKFRVLEAAMVIPLVLLVETAIHYIGIPAWSVFIPLIFFHLKRKDKKKIPSILIGSMLGILVSWLTSQFISVAAPYIGDFAPKLIILAMFLFSLIVFGHRLSLALNDYAFVYFLVAGATKGFEMVPMVLAGILIGVGIMISGLIGIDILIRNIKVGNKLLGISKTKVGIDCEDTTNTTL